MFRPGLGKKVEALDAEALRPPVYGEGPSEIRIKSEQSWKVGKWA